MKMEALRILAPPAALHILSRLRGLIAGPAQERNGSSPSRLSLFVSDDVAEAAPTAPSGPQRPADGEN
jgi:hypothetical protein